MIKERNLSQFRAILRQALFILEKRKGLRRRIRSPFGMLLAAAAVVAATIATAVVVTAAIAAVETVATAEEQNQQ